MQHKEHKVSTFDERKDAFENKFAHEQNVTFKIEALRNKLLGIWAAEVKGLDEDETENYIREVVKSDFQEAGDEDVFRKLKADLKGLVNEQVIRTKMSECLQAAKDRLSSS
tara:strand:- start:107 stop:439 length:333 start_codon:yes stop_codon:yes gene_type:complete